MATLPLIEKYEENLGSIHSEGIEGGLKDHLAGSLPDVSAYLSSFRIYGVPVVPQSMRLDALEAETAVKTGIVDGVMDWINSVQIGGMSIKEALDKAIGAIVEQTYSMLGGSQQYNASQNVMQQISNGDSTLQSGIERFSSSLPKNLQPPEGLISGLTVMGIQEASSTFGGLMGDAFSGASETVMSTVTGRTFDSARNASGRIAEKVYERMYSGMTEYYIGQGVAADKAREYATAVAEEYTGMRLTEDPRGNPSLQPAPEGEHGGLRAYLENIIDAGKDGKDIRAIELDSSTPQGLIALKRAEEALKAAPAESAPAAAPDGEDVTSGTHVSALETPQIHSSRIATVATIG